MGKGPRIEAFWPWLTGEEEDTPAYRAWCCANYRASRWTYVDPQDAQADLSSHLRREHGMMIEPHLLVIGEVPEQ